MFKGGTALRIVFGSPRFSEDLDFSGFGITVDSIENWVLEATGDVEQQGLGVRLEEGKTTSGGYLTTLDCHPYDYLGDYPIHSIPSSSSDQADGKEEPDCKDEDRDEGRKGACIAVGLALRCAHQVKNRIILACQAL